MKKSDVKDMFGAERAVLGMIHLPPLPGAPYYGGSMNDVIEHALRDAETLAKNGVNSMIIENLGDYPYFPETEECETVAAMTRVALEIRKRYDMPLGINILRNSWKAAIAVAYLADCQFIRLNILTDAYVTDQGIITGAAHLATRYRKAIGADKVKFFCDIYAKHGGPIVKRDLTIVAGEMVHRGMADAIIISEGDSSMAPSLEKIEKVKNALPDTPIFLGSGMSLKTADILKHVDGTVFGFGTKPSGDMNDPVDGPTVKAFVDKVKSL